MVGLMTQSSSGTTGQMRVILKSANKKIFHAILSIASAALLIKVIGMLNQLVVTAHFGESAAMDAYLVASALPLMIAGLLGGTIESSVIPAYARVRSRGAKDHASILFSTVLNLLLIGTALLTTVMFLFRYQMVFISAPALDSFRMNLATNITFIIYPLLLLLTITHFLECILNTEGQFGWPSYAGILVPISIGLLVAFFGKSQGVVMLGVGMGVGLCLQLAALVIRARRAKIVYRFVLNLRDPAMGFILITAWPAFLGAFISQSSLFIDQVFSSFLTTGNISALYYALKLIEVPILIIFIPVGRAALPYLSQQAAINDMTAFRRTLHLYSWIVGVGTFVGSILMLLLAHPLIQLLFQHGAFTASDTDRTSWTFMCFVLGLVPMSFNFIVARAFSALGKTRILMFLGIYNIIANSLFDYIFAHFWQSEGIALATSAVYFGAMFILYFLLCRTVGKIDIFSLPPDLKNYLRKFDGFAHLGQIVLRTCMIIAVFSAGIVGILVNDIYTLRISLGSIGMLTFLRFRFALVITWVILDIFIGSTITIFNGIPFNTALTVPTLLSLTTISMTAAFRRMPGLGFLLLFLLWVFASIGISVIGIAAFLTNWILLLDYFSVCVIVIHEVKTRKRLMGLIDAILLVSQFAALYGIYSFLTHQNGVVDPTTSIFRTFSLFGASPTFALYLSIVIPLMIYRTITLRGFLRILGLLGLMVLLIALGVTFTRSALISVPLSIVFMTLFLPSRQLKMTVFGSILLLSIVLVLLVTFGNVPIFERFFNQDILTFNNRTYLWQAVLDHFDPTQLLGNGLDSSNVLLTKLQVGYGGVIATTPHNLYLEIMYDHGIIGLALILLVFIGLFFNMINRLRGANAEHRILFAASLAALVSMFLQSFESNDLWVQGISLSFWIILTLPFVCYWPSAQSADAEDDISSRETMPQLPILKTEQPVQHLTRV